jgi:polysaccharide biosynthesis transport protein
LSKYQQQKGIIAGDERLDVENTRLNELSSQFTAVQAISAESAGRQAQAQGPNAERLPEVLGNAIVGSLKADINRGEAALQQLTTRLGDNHPQVQEARANLAELRERLKAETARVTGSVTMGNSINRSRQNDIKAALDAQRAKVLQMKAVRDEGMVLIREVENAQRTYDAILARVTQSSLESQATQSNVNQLTVAVPPLEPATPRVLLNCVLALLLGALLAVIVALVLELRDRRVRNLDDLVLTLGLPVIGALPKAGSKLLPGGRTSLMRQRLLAPLPQPGKGF